MFKACDPTADDVDTEFAFSPKSIEEGYALMLQDIVRRLPALTPVTVKGSNTRNKMRPDGHGGWAGLITGDEIVDHERLKTACGALKLAT
ncbi:hypothetical protein [Asticcacaulis sp. YBE204]|uniref:hypothetical protein n=1 Tax=Asticcacaulis sp. YBE204 TaxID=1282363 RepID=UPI0003C3EC18|nr:hypothetical protein [Asticcacaulis sp. YBE204]ESQ79258.1 hypothetical protein AEYBE204_09620 [Asticcacaulis sp. YBE204]